MKRYINRKYVEITEDEMTQIQAEEEEFKKSDEYKQMRISELKQKLLETDYVACKIAEGSATIDEYSHIINQRQLWRDEINNLDGTNNV